MNGREGPQTEDWRARLRSLPSGEKPGAYERWMTFLLRVVFYGMLAVAGLVCSIFAGALIGLKMGISPESSGTYLMIGAAFSTPLAAVVSWLLKRQGHARVRWIFYTLALPAPLVILLAVSLGA